MNYAIGIDLGGTNTRVALVDEKMKLADRVQFPTAADDPECSVKEITKTIKDFGDVDISGIGMSCPGPLDLNAGTVITTPNLGPEWYGFPITEKLTEAAGIPAKLDNDANLAALAEAVVGAGSDLRYVQFLTISTGVGSGFVIDKKIFHGAHGFANEVANACMWQDGPRQGNLVPGGIETISSGTAITRRAVEAGLHVAHAGEVNDLAIAGNRAAAQIMEDAKTYLANFISVLYAVNDPDIVILGGSVALKIPGFAEDIEERVRHKVFDVVRPHVHVVTSTLDENSGLLGAACLGFSLNN